MDLVQQLDVSNALVEQQRKELQVCTGCTLKYLKMPSTGF